MKILVIGGTRFIGAHAVRRLAHTGNDVTVFHRGEHAGALPSTVKHLQDPSAALPVVTIPEALRRLKPEIVLHMIAMGEADTLAAVSAFTGIARRLVLISSGDVYRAYAIFRRLDAGPPVPTPILEEAELRRELFPYRTAETPRDSLEFYYEKILAERAAMSDTSLPWTILRLPKVYGREQNADLATVYGFRHQPQWRWTYAHVENVAAAIALAVEDERAANRIYNVGEETTPSMGERLQQLPAQPNIELIGKPANFAQDLVLDTSRIRRELGYAEVIDESTAMAELGTSLQRLP